MGAGPRGDREDRLYGTLKSSVLDPLAAGKNLVMSIDVQGVESLRRVARTDERLRRAMTTIFIVVDHERLVARMRERAKDHDDEISRRLATAEAELREAAKFDQRIESRTRDEDFAALLAIVRDARHRATGLQPDTAHHGSTARARLPRNEKRPRALENTRGVIISSLNACAPRTRTNS